MTNKALPNRSQGSILSKEESSDIIEKRNDFKKKSGWFQKIPSDILFSPVGLILIFLAITIEVIDALIPVPFISQIWGLPLEIIFIILLISTTHVSLKSCLIPFIIERIPIVSSILPTWLMRMFM